MEGPHRELSPSSPCRQQRPRRPAIWLRRWRRRAVVFEHFRTATGSALCGANIVFDRNGDTGQGTSRFAACDAAIDVSGCGRADSSKVSRNALDVSAWMRFNASRKTSTADPPELTCWAISRAGFMNPLPTLSGTRPGIVGGGEQIEDVIDGQRGQKWCPHEVRC